MARLPKSIIKKYGITKKAWSVFRGRKGKRKGAKPKTKKKGKRSMGRRKKRRGGKSMTRTAFKLIRLGALIGGGAAEASQYGNTQDMVIGGLLGYGGYHWGEKRFDWQVLLRVWAPYIGACLTTYGIPKMTSIIRRL